MKKVKIHPEGKFIVDIDPKIKIDDIKPNIRVALKSDSYVLHKILPNKVKGVLFLWLIDRREYMISAFRVGPVSRV